MPAMRNESRSAGQSPPMISSSPSIDSEIGCAFNRRVRKPRQEYAPINMHRCSTLAIPSCRFLVFVQQERQLALKHLRITTNVESPTAELAQLFTAAIHRRAASCLALSSSISMPLGASRRQDISKGWDMRNLNHCESNDIPLVYCPFLGR